MEDLVGARFHPRWGASRRNIFASTLSVGAKEAVVLAETRYRDTLIAVGRIGDRLKRDMLYELLDVEQSGSFGEISVPSADDVSQIAAMRERVDAIAEILGLPRESVRKRMLPLLDQLMEAARRIPNDFDIRKLTSLSRDGSNIEKKVLPALIDWSKRAPQARRIKSLSDMVGNYNDERSNITESTDRYVKMVEEYLRDSKKSVQFDDSGYISFKRKDSKTGIEVDIDSLSSGEAQIFVILTNLFFHPQAQSDNVFIIDEPELSLHIQWQEMFVDSMISANKNIQYIMATHSPSIIMDKISLCEEVLPLRKKRQG
ncbi:AAA family ATPase [Brevundimonas naejangsanensis]